MSARTRRATRRDGTPTPRTWKNLTLGVGLVNVDVSLAPLMAADQMPKGHTVCGVHQAQVKMAWYCPAGDHYLEPGDTERCFEHNGQLVHVDTEQLAAEADGRIDLERLVLVDGIDPLYFEKAYLVWPQDGHGSGYDLIAQVLRASGKALIGRCVLTRSTRLLAIRWSEATGTLVVRVCQYDANIRWNDVQLVNAGQAARPEPNEQHLALAEQVLGAMTGDFEPETEDAYRVSLEKAIEQAASGRPAPAVKAVTTPAPVVDLMDALKASLAASGADTKKTKPRSRRNAAA